MKKVHFIGIGGISMSALALELRKSGTEVSGSDMTLSHITARLADAGIKVYEGHAAESIDGAELIVKTSAIKEDNPELAAARKKGVRIIERAVLLGEIMRKYNSSIAVAGMHGKTTATGLIASALVPLRPAVHIGGELNQTANEEWGIEPSDLFITEACEYCRNFLHLAPDVAVVLNIDEDHLDYFKDLQDIISAFDEFAGKIRAGGMLIYNGDDENCRKLNSPRKISFGLGENCDYRATEITSEKGRYSFTVKGERINLGIFGRHQVYNALAAFAVGDIYGVPHGEIKKGIESFGGVKRRFELFPKKLSGADVIIDYAHHPKEIAALLSAVREAGYEKIHCVFQPHTYSRTETLLSEFAACFRDADSLILMPVYAAREKAGKVNSLTLLNEINKQHREVSVQLPSAAPPLQKNDCIANQRKTLLRKESGEGKSATQKNLPSLSEENIKNDISTQGAISQIPPHGGCFAEHIENGADVIEELRKRANKNDAVIIAGAGNIVDICKFI